MEKLVHNADPVVLRALEVVSAKLAVDTTNKIYRHFWLTERITESLEAGRRYRRCKSLSWIPKKKNIGIYTHDKERAHIGGRGPCGKGIPNIACPGGGTPFSVGAVPEGGTPVRVGGRCCCARAI